MAFKQPRVPEYRERDGADGYIRSLVLFLKDFCMDVWTANNQRAGEIGAVKAGYPVTSVCGKTGDVALTAADVGALPSGGTAANASKLGGKAPEYYVQPRNLLDNSDFLHPVNQRGETSKNTNGYFIDRWIIYSPDESKRATSINENGITTSGGGAVRQLVPAKLVPKDISEYTFAVCKSNGYIDFPGTWKDSNGNLVCPISQAGTYIWAALYKGSYTAGTLPPYVPKGYASELAECQRYFYSLTSYWKYVGAGICTSATECKIPIRLPQAMRIMPTVTIADRSLVKIKAGSVAIQVPSAVSWENATRIYDMLYMECTITGATDGDIAMLYFDNGGRINISADL